MAKIKSHGKIVEGEVHSESLRPELGLSKNEAGEQAELKALIKSNICGY